MSIFDSIINLFRTTKTRKPKTNVRARLTTNREHEVTRHILQRPSDELDFWRMSLDPQILINLPTEDLQEILPRISDPINKAFWDTVIFIGSAYDVKAYVPGTERAEIDEAATAVLHDFITQLDNTYDSFLNLIHRIISGGFMRGAFAAELILDEMAPVGLATPDPHSFRFIEAQDEIFGNVWLLGQFQNGQFVSFAGVPTIKYVPILPMVNSPYGISWIESAIFPALFLMLLLQDTRRVIANYGYPREDIVINMERLLASMPANAAKDPAEVKKWVDSTISEIAAVISSLEPNDAWVHTDDVSREPLKGALGGQGANFAGELDKLINSIERMIIRGLKTMPFLLASRQSTTERQATIEWQAYQTGIDIIQRKLASMLNGLFTIALEAQGIQAEVYFEFSKVEINNPLVDAQTEEIEIRNAANKRNEGWITNDEASQEITGTAAVDEANLLNELQQTRELLIYDILEKTNANSKNNGRIEELWP